MNYAENFPNPDLSGDRNVKSENEAPSFTEIVLAWEAFFLATSVISISNLLVYARCIKYVTLV